MKRFAIAVSFSVVALLIMGLAVFYSSANPHHQAPAIVAESEENSGALSNATVSFGGWMTDIPLDRFPNNANTQFPITRNHHALTPEIAKIKAGGTVNFIIGGFHVVTVYDDGTEPEDIDTSLLTTPANGGPPIIDDPNRRIYRGLDPTILPATAAQDRVEVVHFDSPGKYLVICAVLPHFNDGMYGYVRVLPGKTSVESK